jgi:UDP-GlcNAc:undecaprenyl-phosphate/decaprenyl-phosphate GlcNAc-1-phosphate transferase
MTLSDQAQDALPALIAGFLLACLVTLVLTPVVRLAAIRVGMIDHPEARRVNTKAIARGGGVAVGIGFVGVSSLMLVVNHFGGHLFVDEPGNVRYPELIALMGGAVLAVAIGLLDDYLQLRARWQFLGQALLALYAFALGVAVTSVNNPLSPDGIATIPELLVGLATVVWVVGMVNSMNFIDGLDGLSSGIGIIAAITLGLISIWPSATQPEPFVALFCFILAGSLLGFLRWNFHPASIFIGTSGIMLVGYSLAVLSILGVAKVAVALLVLGVPIIDTFWIIVRRLASGRSPFAPDRGHIHHRLLDLGLSQRATVLLIYGVCVILAGLSLGLSNTGITYAFLGLAIAFGLALLGIERLGGGATEIAEGLSAASYGNGGASGQGTAGDDQAPGASDERTAEPPSPLAEDAPDTARDDHAARIAPPQPIRPGRQNP